MTVGAVVMRSMSYSRSRRSCTMSMCSMPRKPQRKPKPRACETSGSNCSEASLSLSFSSASRSASYSLASTGYRPANTEGLISLKPGSGSLAAGETWVMVSPTLACLSSFMPVMMKPTCPAESVSRGDERGVKTPSWSHWCWASVAIMRMRSRVLSVPLTTRTSITTPT